MAASRRIDQWLGPGQAFIEAARSRMRRHQQPARQGRDLRHGRPKSRNLRRVRGEVIFVARYGGDAVRISHGDAAPRLARPPRPAGRARCVPRRRMGGQHQPAQRKPPAVVDHSSDPGARIALHDRVLRVRRLTAPGFQRSLARFPCDQRRARPPLQFRQPTGMVAMFMTIQQITDIAQPKAEPLDVRRDQRCRSFRPAINQDVTLGRGYQQGNNAAGADVIGVAVHARRRGRVGPAVLAPARCRQRRPIHSACCRGQQQRRTNGHSSPRSRR